MKRLLLVSVLLCGVLALTAAEDVAVKAVPRELQGDTQVAEPEVEALVPEEENPEVFSGGEMASSPEDRFFTCPSGWTRYKNSCYLYVRSGRSWASAATYCSSLGASLASVRDVFDYSFLQDLTRASGSSVAWLGGFYFHGWRWVDQNSFGYTYWSSQNAVNVYQCLHLNTQAGWSNNNCNNAWTFICMRRTDTC
ncbi:ladderlectin isoform X10 [Lates calcarifer]|uniref:Ladderlectin isoform X10 n=1 Tax=Lates calcarifer TaxID=8187 RepID=A0AAJ8DX63_LATCA|nr:ladderlectin isoform X5 [Lates calcarifer]XP_050934124.1 ladderlectin isoform X7 [Lates calcarifer]XP_050934128.1 ladderlectin isoform X10 [Lates calcarifer]